NARAFGCDLDQEGLAAAHRTTRPRTRAVPFASAHRPVLQPVVRGVTGRAIPAVTAALRVANAVRIDRPRVRTGRARNDDHYATTRMTVPTPATMAAATVP